MKKFRNFFLNSFIYCLAIELVEEILEDVIAFGLSSLFVKGISTLLVVSISQGGKIIIKTAFKKAIYKEGNDKVSKLKNAFKWIFANKCTLGGIAVGAVTVVSGTGVIDVNSFPELLIGGFNATPVIYYGFLGIMAIVCSFFTETYDKFKARLDVVKAEKEEKALEREAKKELVAEEKVANQTQTEQEKARAKAEAEAKAKEEKEKVEAEHKAKVEAIKAKILAEKNAENK